VSCRAAAGRSSTGTREREGGRGRKVDVCATFKKEQSNGAKKGWSSESEGQKQEKKKEDI